MWQKYIFLSLSLEMPFKAGELGENANGVSIGREQKTREYSESIGKETREVGKKQGGHSVTEAERKGYY